MSQKVIQFPGTGARTAAGNHSGIVLRIGPRRYRLDIPRPATGRGEPEDEVRPLPGERLNENGAAKKRKVTLLVGLGSLGSCSDLVIGDLFEIGYRI